MTVAKKHIGKRVHMLGRRIEACCPVRCEVVDAIGAAFVSVRSREQAGSRETELPIRALFAMRRR